MMRALWTASTGMAAQQANIDVISNNLANVSTNGFKKSRSDFEDLMYQTMRQPGTSSGPDTQLPTGVQIGCGVRQVAVTKVFLQGNFQETGNSLDMAIEGNGFFQVTLPDGTVGYTRNGAFNKDSTGRVVTSEGYPLEPAITIPTNATDVGISSDGIVSATIAGQTASQDLGQIQLATFVNPAGLDSTGHNIYKETSASGSPVVANPGVDGAGSIAQKILETSNVQVVEEMVNMIVAQRAYEMNSKAVQTADSMLGTTASLKQG